MSNSTTLAPACDPSIAADEEAVIDRFLTGKPLAAEVAQRVHECAQGIRADILRKHGLIDIAVPAIRELRGDLPE